MDGILTEQSRVESFLEAHPDHNDLLKPFKFGFVANYAAEFVFANTNIYIFTCSKQMISLKNSSVLRKSSCSLILHIHIWSHVRCRRYIKLLKLILTKTE